MGEPLSPNRVFDFPKDELEPHPAYDLFVPALFPGYAGNPNNNNGWLTPDDYLLGEIKAMVGEQMVVPTIEEVAEPVAEVEEEQVIAPVADMEKRQMDVSMIDMDEDLAVLFGEDDDLKNDSEGPSTAVAEGPSFLHLAPGLSVPSFVIEDLSNRLGNLEYGHGKLVQRVNQVSEAEMVHAAERWEQVGAQVEQDVGIYWVVLQLDWPNLECGMIPVGGSFARV
nr:hypothetical protein [Tanacetum cinerariifolium]